MFQNLLIIYYVCNFWKYQRAQMIKEGSLMPLYGSSDYSSRQKYQRPSSSFLMTQRIKMLLSHYEGSSMFHHPFFQDQTCLDCFIFHTIQNTMSFLCKHKSVCLWYLPAGPTWVCLLESPRVNLFYSTLSETLWQIFIYLKRDLMPLWN